MPSESPEDPWQGESAAGFARVWYAPAERLEQLAIYRATVAGRESFVENDEMTHSLWWHPSEELPDLTAIHGALVALCPQER